MKHRRRTQYTDEPFELFQVPLLGRGSSDTSSMLRQLLHCDLVLVRKSSLHPGDLLTNACLTMHKYTPPFVELCLNKVN